MAIQKLNYGWQAGGGYVEPTHEVMCDKINALVDAVNELHEEAENNARIRANHENLIDTLVEENNIHEKQIDELQTKVNKLAPNINFAQPEVKENVQDEFAEQRKWIGKLCWVLDDDGDERAFTRLTEIIEDDDDRPFKGLARWKHCEPVKPTDSIIYKGGDNA